MGDLPAKKGYDKTAKYARFVSEYIKDYNATQAYLRAFPGTKYKSAQTQATTMRKVPEVMEMIERQTQGRIRLNEITAERVTLELARIGFSDVRRLVKAGISTDGTITEQPLMLHEIDEDTARAIKEVEFDAFKGTKLKLHSKENALGLLAKITGAVKGTDRNTLNSLPGQASTMHADHMLDEEIAAALNELETAGDDEDDVIDMDDDGSPIMDDTDD